MIRNYLIEHITGHKGYFIASVAICLFLCFGFLHTSPLNKGIHSTHAAYHQAQKHIVDVSVFNQSSHGTAYQYKSRLKIHNDHRSFLSAVPIQYAVSCWYPVNIKRHFLYALIQRSIVRVSLRGPPIC